MTAKLPLRTEKPWGFELLWAHTQEYAGKLIYIKKGHRLSLQYHKKKDESIYVHEGRVLIETGAKDGETISQVALPGFCIRISPLTRHRLKAIEDTMLFEVSTPQLEDVERLEDDYQRATHVRERRQAETSHLPG